MSKRNTTYVPCFKTERLPDYYTVWIHVNGGPPKELGKLDRITRTVPGGQSHVDVPDSLAFLCTRCGDYWARLAFLPQGRGAEHWMSLDRECRKCGDGSLEPYLGGRHDEIMQLFSSKLWERELEIIWEGAEMQEFLRANGITGRVI